ncbi:MAG: ATP-binding protein, partial [Leeuwenhoekiella sp.]
ATVINMPEENNIVVCNRAALYQIFINLIGNSIKYNDKDHPIIDISFEESKDFYHLYVKDNGIGISEEKIESIFDLFHVATDKDKNGNRGNGIGLSTVKKLVTNLGGNIDVDSTVGKGTTFTFSLCKDDKPCQVVPDNTLTELQSK